MKRNRRAITVGALLVVGAIVLSGCGGSSGKRLSKEQFAAKANALCSDYQKKAKALGDPKSTAEAVSMIGKYKELFGKMVVDFKKLKPPANEQAAVDRTLAISKEQLGINDQMIAALKKSDTASFQKLVKKGDAMDTVSNGILRKLGATTCAQ
jgi:hypothetical protein